VSREAERVAKDSRDWKAEVDRSPWRFEVRHMIYAVFYSAILCWLVILVRAPIVVGVFVVFGGALVAIGVKLARRRSRQHDSLILMMAIAADHEMSLASAIRVFSENARGKYRRALLSAADELDFGVPLPEVLDHHPGVLSKDLEMIVRMGWWTGSLGQALREASTNRLAFRPVWSAIAWKAEYLILLTFSVQTILGFLLYYIIPKLEWILGDLGMGLPPITLQVIMASHWVGNRSYLLGLAGILEMVGMFYFPFSFFGMPDRGITPIDQIFVRRHSVLILRALAWVLDSGKPLPAGIQALVNWYPVDWVNERLRRVQLDVQHGIDWIASLKSHGLIRSVDVTILESARRVGNLPWALRTVADMGERRFLYRVQLFLQVTYPLLLTLLGLLIGLICVAFFAPLVQVIERLA